MNYQETIDYIFSALPMFHRVGPAAYKPNLDNTLALAAAIGNPEKDLRCIHIAGTNGKGSTSHMLASVLQEAGFRTGLYTSPHLKDFRERIRVNGEMVSEEWVAHFVTGNKKIFDKISPSFFEMSTIMAFYYFQQMRTDIAVIETGLGGRLDSTNIITPFLSVITNIGMDHMNLLGDTLEKIAGEKAGIIKSGVPVVIGESNLVTNFIFNQQAAKENAPIHFANDHFSLEVVKHDLLDDKIYFNVFKDGQPYLETLSCDLNGKYQLKNILTVLQALDLVREELHITDEHIRKGLADVKGNTGLKGRWQILSRQPLIICDTGHNEDGWKEVLEMIESLSFHRLHFVLGVVEDKDLSKMLHQLPVDATYYFCKADIPRGLNAELLREMAERYGLKGLSYSSVNAALNAAKSEASNKDLIFVGGSTFTVAEVV
ncbi:MAG: bifunctional folylpolyglutamate synthase/dihydrofolate synthase [Bacteroidetes bacterium]|nr:bifunctional folylpolyglutamate synthase/dihydrofolate synthase [Bacteroidota bacterium]